MYYQLYQQQVNRVLEAIFQNEAAAIERAGALLADSLEQDGLLFVFGCGHSHILAEELFYRAGGLAAVYPIFETAAMLHEGAAKSSQVERMSGYAKHVIARYPVSDKDCMLVVSTSGINPFPMEMAQGAKDRGAKVIGISSFEYRGRPSRREDGKHLPDFCDICINNHVPAGDASVEICADGTMAGPVSTIASVAIANSIALTACEKLRGQGIEPRVFKSGNCPGTDEHNAAILSDFLPRIRHL